MNVVKIAVNIVIALLLPINAFGKLGAPLVYTIEQSTSATNELTVRVHPLLHAPTRLILRGASFGIKSQINAVTCNGRKVNEEQPGIWAIPKTCDVLRWQILLPETTDILAAAQQSVRHKEFILISEASSLPRLENVAAPEMLEIAINSISTSYPLSNNGIPLPDNAAAPLFVLLNATNMGKLTAGPISLSYFLDDPKHVLALPKMTSHMKGLQWLERVTQKNTKMGFTIGWLGVAGNKMNLSGATGDDILLVNYPNDHAPTPFNKTMLLYIALHEAFHQLNPQGQAAWIAESLASYYGVRALESALPNNSDVSKLIERFQTDASRYQKGLLNINKDVETGDRSQYGAFYTKGLAFWVAVDKALLAQGDNLDQHLPAILEASDNLFLLQNILNIPAATWTSLRKNYLD